MLGGFGLSLAILKGGLFLLSCWFVSRRGIPQLLHAVARTRSRELFTVTVVGLCAAVVDDWIRVEEAEIAAAMRLVYQMHHMTIEGAAGVAAAAILLGRPDS